MSWRGLGRYVLRDRARYAAGLAFLLATNACALAIPWVVKDTVDALSQGAGGRAGAEATTRAAVATGALLVVGLALVQGVTRSASRLTLLGAAQRVEARIRDDLVRALLRLEPAFFQARRTGDLMSRATNDLQHVGMLIGFGCLSLVNTGILYVGTLVAMLRIDPWLTAAALAPYPLLVGLAKRYNTRAHAEALAVQEQVARLSAKVQENVSGMAVVRAYTMEPQEVAAFRTLNAEYLARVLAQARTQGTFSPLMGIMTGVGALTVLWVGGKGVVDGRITLGALVAFSSYLGYLAWPTMALGWVLAIVRRGLSAMDRVVEVLGARPAIADGPEARGPVEITGEIELRGLTFTYETGRRPALRDLSLRIPAGSTVAVVGPTGAGKTTLASLLPRLWDPPVDTLFLDGREIHTIPLRDLRAAIGHVPQEAFLFSRPLAENLDFADADTRSPDEAEGLHRAGAVAGLGGDVARLPEGWETVVGERGLTLSGGQRQRATLARALLRDPRILILDDAFASVDAEKEAEILAALRPVLSGRTTLVITHRLRAARVANRIVVLDDGRLAEEGTHDELMARGGLYARLWRRQQVEDAVLAAG